LPLRFSRLGDTTQEWAVESAPVQNVMHFLLELGAGFAFVGRQMLLDVGSDHFFIDLPFLHLQLRCYVVIERKSGKFKPEHLGQLGFHLTAVDVRNKSKQDGSTIGLLRCKSKNKAFPVEYLGMEQGVNVTPSLPFVRTGPDEGTAFNIAGKAIADPSSVRAAIRMARGVIGPTA
jgi:hypothetical protein